MHYRKIYEHHYGPIPKGYHVHHKDMNHANDDPLNLEALQPDEHAKKHGFLSNWIMSQARATGKESVKLARAEALRRPENRAKARARMLGKQIALGKKHTDKQRRARAERMCGNKRAYGARYTHKEGRTPEYRLKISLALRGKKRGMYKKTLTRLSKPVIIQHKLRKRRIIQPEHRLKISETMTGKKRGPYKKMAST